MFLTSDHHQVDGCPYLLKMNLIMCNRFFGLIGAAIVICMTGNPLHAQVFLDEYSSPDGITYLLDRDANTAQVKGLTNVSDIVNIPQGITVNDTTYTVVSIDIIDGENLDNVTQVNLPASLQFFGQGNASLFPNLQKLYSWAVIPPFVSGDKSEHVLYVPDEETPSCTLYVPSVSLDYYRADSCWQSFAAIVAIDAPLSSIIVTNNIGLTIPSDLQIRDLTISSDMTGGDFGHLTLNGGGLQTGIFRIRYDRNADYDQNQDDILHTNDATMITYSSVGTANAVTEMFLMPYKWTFVSFPYDVKVSEIVYPDSADFVIRSYDGNARAVSDFEGSWKNMTVDSTLLAGKGYIIQVRNFSITSWQEGGESYTSVLENGAPLLKFPASSTNTNFTSAKVTVKLENYPSEFKQNVGWNLIGNPYPCCFDMKYTDYTGIYWVWDCYSDSFVPKSTIYDDYVLLPGEAFFIQCPKDRTSLTFSPEGRSHDRIPVTHDLKAASRGAYALTALSFKAPLKSVGPHGEWNPSNPGDPGCNLWDAEIGRVMIDYSKTGGLGTAIDNAIGLTEGQNYFEETMAEIRGRVKEIIVAGPFDASDLWVTNNYPNCVALDLRRTTGWRKIPTGAFNESLLQTIILPECLDSIDYESFTNYSQLNAIHLYSQLPPIIDEDAFDSIPKGVTAYVPASAYPLYLTDPVWSRMNIVPFTDQVGAISATLPSDWTDGRYKGLKIQVTSNQYGYRNSFLITDKGTYLFNNLVKDGSYKVELKRNDGITLSRIDDITASLDGTQAILPEVFSMYSDMVKVVTADGMDITGLCRIKWFNSDGTLACDNYYIKDITEGSELDYTITLPERYALEFSISDSVFHFTQGSENAILQHALIPIPTTRLRGTVTDAATGRPIDGAQIVATYRVSGGYTRSFTAQSLQDGSFSMDALERNGNLTVVADGFFDMTTNIDATASSPVSLEIERLHGQRVAISVSYTKAGDDENPPVTTQGYSEMSDLRYSFYSSEKQRELTGYRLQYPYLWFVSDTIGANDCIMAEVSSKKGVFDDIETELYLKSDGQDTLAVNIHERGRLKVSYTTADDRYFNVILFNEDGNKISGGQSTSKEVMFRNIPEGGYTVVAASGKNGYISIARLEQLEELGLEADVDYVSASTWVERGWTGQVEFQNLPALDITGKNYLASGSFESEKVKVYDGDFTTLDCQFSFRPDLTGKLDNINAVIDLPAGCVFKKGSILLNGVPADADLLAAGNAYKVIVPIQNGALTNNIRLSVVPSLTGTAYFAASVNFTSDATRQTALIGSAQVRVEGIAIHAQTMAIKDTISISGTAPADASVLVYDGDRLIASTTASLGHQWFVRAGLVEPELLSRHSISARIQSENGWVSTDTVSCLYNPYGVYNAGILMELYSPQISYDVCDVYDARQRGDIKIPKTYRPYSPGWYNNTSEGQAAKNAYSFGLEINKTTGGIGLMPWDDYYSWNGAAVYFDLERGEAEPSYTLGNFNTFIYNFQAYFPDCDSTDVQDLEFHVLHEDSTVRVLKAHFKEKGHWESSLAYGSEQALPVNILRTKYTPNRSIPFDSIPYMKMMESARTQESELRTRMERLEELRQTALRLEAKESLTAAEEAQLQKCLEEGLNLMPKSDYQLTDEQKAYLETLSGLDYEDQIKGLKNLPGVNVSQDMIDYMLGMNNSIPLKGTVEPREIYPGYYSPRITYNFNYCGNLTGLLNAGADWKLEMLENNTQILLSDSKGDFIRLENIYVPGTASLVKQRGDGMPVSALPSMQDIDEVLSGLGDVSTATGLATGYLDIALNSLADNSTQAVSNALGLAEASTAIGAVGQAAGAVGALLEGKAAWEAMNRDNHSGWLELGRGNQDVMGVEFLQQTEAIAQGVADWNAAVCVGHIALAAVGIIAMVAFGPVGGLVIGLLSAYGSYKLDSMDKELQAQNANLLAMWQDYIKGKRTNDSKPNRDPSGFVYEGVESNRLSGVTATVYQKYMVEDSYGNWDEVIVPWDAGAFDQVNPQQTDQDGMYAWDVPEGSWRVVFNMEGYEPDTTEWLSVPPPQLDVNIGLTSYVAPYVKAVRAFENGIDIYFSKYMRSVMLTDANIAVTYKGQAIAGEIVLSDAEWGPGVDEELASRVRFMPDDLSFTAGDDITLIVSSRTESYAGVPMESGFVQDFTVEREVEYLYTPEIINLRAGQTANVAIEAGPAIAACSHEAVITLKESMTISVSADTVTFDTLGIANIDIMGLSIGQAIIDVKVIGFDLTGSVQVNVLPDSLFPAPPYASVKSGEAVQPGTSVRLLCDSLEYTIYYTLDGTDPLDPDNPETYRYDDPIVIDSAMTVTAVVEVNGLYSNPATFNYQVIETGIRFMSKDRADELLYDLKGRSLDAEPALSPYIRENRIQIKK